MKNSLKNLQNLRLSALGPSQNQTAQIQTKKSSSQNPYPNSDIEGILKITQNSNHRKPFWNSFWRLLPDSYQESINAVMTEPSLSQKIQIESANILPANKLKNQATNSREEITKVSEKGKVEENMDENMPNQEVEDRVIQEFVKLKHEVGFLEEWIESFIWSMKSDFYWQDRINLEHGYKTMEDTQKYIYGSADVVGLMMCKILNLPEKAYFYGQKLGFAFQYINFIRDIDEDVQLGRNYFPESEMSKYELTSLDKKDILTSPEKIKSFQDFLRTQIDLYRTFQSEAAKGFGYIPFRYRLPIITASKMYLWTAQTIYKNPLIIFQKKVKPTKFRIIMAFVSSLFSSLLPIPNPSIT